MFGRRRAAAKDTPRSYAGFFNGLLAEHQLRYGWYGKKNPELIETLRSLTAGTFKSGAVARILAFEFWAKGEAPTLRQFASRWLEAEAEGLGVARGDHPEAAWLTDRARGEGGATWKAKRARKAKEVLRLLSTLSPPSKVDE